MHYFAGAHMIICGVFINYLVGKRRFNRRGLRGLQHFRSYNGLLFTRIFELLFKWLGIGSILFGIGLLWRNQIDCPLSAIFKTETNNLAINGNWGAI